MSAAAYLTCEDCFTCIECGRNACDYRPMCEHQRVCDPCFPNGCEECIAMVERDEAL